MSTTPPSDLSGLRREAVSAGPYGNVIVPAAVLVWLIDGADNTDEVPSVDDLRGMIRDADRAAGDAEDAASALYEASRELEKALNARHGVRL